MSVLIKNMKMPKNCLTCPCTDSEYGECVLDPEKRCPENYGKRAEWCPLLPVPPHGRLIDADALAEMLEKYKKEYALKAKKDIVHLHKAWGLYEAELMAESLPTIIPAEEGE